ncbi:NAAT1 protein, partial [Acromyrmex heyeri]
MTRFSQTTSLVNLKAQVYNVEHDLVEQTILLNTKEEYSAWEQRCDKFIESLKEYVEDDNMGHIENGLIKNLSRLVSNLPDSQLTRKKNRKYFCDRCLHYFSSSAKLEIHSKDCGKLNLECALKKTNGNPESSTYTYHHHNVFSIGSYVHCSYDSSLSGYRFRRDKYCIAWFAEELRNLAHSVQAIISANVPIADFTRDDWQKFNSTTHCHIFLVSNLDILASFRSKDKLRILQFYSSLTDDTISENAYVHAVNVWRRFSTLGEYSDLYLKLSSYLMYYDVNNLYGWAMCQSLPYIDFQWVDDVQNFNFTIIALDSATGYILEVDAEYPQHTQLNTKFRTLAKNFEKNLYKLMNNEQFTQILRTNLVGVAYHLGIGYGVVVSVFSVITYYCALMALMLYYMVASCQGEQAKNGSRSSADPYFRKYVLNEMGIEDGLGLSSWKLVLALLASWIFVYVVICKSVKSNAGFLDSSDTAKSLMTDDGYFNFCMPLSMLLRSIPGPSRLRLSWKSHDTLSLVYRLIKKNIMTARKTYFDCKLINVKLFLNPKFYPYDDLNLDFDKRGRVAILFDMYLCFCLSYYSLNNLGITNIMRYEKQAKQKTCRDCTNVTSLDLCTSLMADTTIFEIFGNLHQVVYSENTDKIRDYLLCGFLATPSFRISSLYEGYLEEISGEIFKMIAEKNNFKIAYKPINTLAKIYFYYNLFHFQQQNKQIFKTLMGSPLSPILAKIVLRDLEEKTLDTLNLNPIIYQRYVYVDDNIMRQENTLMTFSFNSFHNRLQFTLEIENDRCLNFLEQLLKIENNKIIVDWFHKKMFSGRYLSFLSNHSTSHKINSILVDRATLLSHPRFHKKNIEFVINILLNNCYPLSLIFNCINKRIKKIIHEKLNTQSKKYFVVPYIPKVSYSITFFNKSIFTIGYKILNTLSSFIKVHKNKFQNQNVVYQINCQDCEASYVRQTKRQLKTLINEHRNNIKQSSSRLSVISDHRLNCDHNFD